MPPFQCSALASVKVAKIRRDIRVEQQKKMGTKTHRPRRNITAISWSEKHAVEMQTFANKRGELACLILYFFLTLRLQPPSPLFSTLLKTEMKQAQMRNFLYVFISFVYHRYSL